MTKWKRRVSIATGALIGVVVILAAGGWMLLRGTPDWYQPLSMSTEQRDAAAQRATNKLVVMQNQAARVHADRSHSDASQTDPITISFTDDEMNAFFQKWSVWQSVRGGYEKYFSDPYLVIQDGRLILAAKLKEINAVASLHFEPRIDEQGQLDLKLVQIRAGRLPLPQKLFSQYQQQLISGLELRVPLWRQYSDIDPTGVANSNTISATMGQLLVNVIRERPSEPLLFLPIVERGCIPVRVSDVKITDHTVTLIVYPMPPKDRADLVQRIRAGQSAEARVQ